MDLYLKQSKDIELQIFYADEINKEFSEENSVKISSLKTEKIKKIPINLNIKKLEKIRIDFGEQPGDFVIEKIAIKGKSKAELKAGEILNSSMSQIETKNITDKEITLKSNGEDPFIVFVGDKIPNKSIKSFDLFLISTTLILIYFIIYKLSLYLKIKKTKSNWRMLSYIFLTYLIFIFPVLKIDNDEIDKNENRFLEKKPRFKINGELNLNFGKETENWLNDHFYKRKKILDFYKKINDLILSRNGNENTLIGKDGWLFYKLDNSVEHYQNIDPYSHEDLEQFEEVLTNRQAWLNKLGIKYYIFIAPDKNKIYGEFYPDYIKKINNIGHGQQLREYLKDKINIIYPYEELLNEKKNELIYWKTDTHWNEYGAFIGYKTLVEKIMVDFPEIKFQKEDDYIKLKTPYLDGDLLKMLGTDSKKYQNDRYYRLIPKNEHSFSVIRIDNNYQKITLDREYDFSSSSITRRNLLVTSSSKPLKVLILRDSFSISMIKYMSETFGNVEYVNEKNFNNLQDKIISEKPDIVIHEIVERYTGTLKTEVPKLKEVN